MTQSRLLATLFLTLLLPRLSVAAAGLNDWFPRDSGTTNNLLAVTFHDGAFLAVGQSGFIATSTDGAVWHPMASGTTNTLRAVTHGANVFVAAGDGTVLVSNNATNWSSKPQASLGLRGVTYGAGTFVAVGHMFTGSNNLAVALTSTNGIDWTRREMGAFDEVNGVSFGNGLFAAITTFERLVLISTNGETWSRTSTPCYNPRLGITYANNRFVAVGFDPYCPTFSISASYDGIAWEDHPPGTDGLFFGVGFGSGTFVAVGGLFDAAVPATRIITSLDGLTWVSRSVPGTSDLHGIAYGNGTFVAVGDRGTILQSGNTGEVILFGARTADGAALRLNITGQSNWAYHLQASTNLVAPEWRDVAVVTNAQNGFVYPDSFDSPTGQRYYRVIAP